MSIKKITIFQTDKEIGVTVVSSVGCLCLLSNESRVHLQIATSSINESKNTLRQKNISFILCGAKESYLSADTTLSRVGVCPANNNCREGLILANSKMSENLFRVEMLFRTLCT